MTEKNKRPSTSLQPDRQRLDLLLIHHGLATTRQQAQRLIMAGQVLVEEHPADKPGSSYPLTAAVRLRGADIPWVSRGGLKLAHALTHWSIDPTGWICLDVGASTGGFTDVLLTHGASRVYAVDVGYGQMAWKLMQDPRVIRLERTNVRHLTTAQIPEPVDFLVMDVSFISLTLALPPAVPLLRPAGVGVVLIKPQFEVGKGKVGKGGVVRDPLLHEEAIQTVLQAAMALDLIPGEVTPSPVLGPSGNREFLFYFSKRDEPA